MAISRSPAPRTAITASPKASSASSASPTVSPSSSAIRPRPSASTAAPSKTSTASKPSGRFYQTKPFRTSNPHPNQPLTRLPNRSQLPRKTPRTPIPIPLPPLRNRGRLPHPSNPRSLRPAHTPPNSLENRPALHFHAARPAVEMWVRSPEFPRLPCRKNRAPVVLEMSGGQFRRWTRSWPLAQLAGGRVFVPLRKCHH